MTVPAAPSFNNHVGNGVTTVFAYGFKILQASDLKVTVDGLLVTNYSVAGVGQAAGGSITFAVAPAAAAAIRIARNMAIARTTDYQFNGNLPATTLNDDQDAPVMMIQQLDEKVGRALRVAEGDLPLNDLPNAAGRANLLLGFDAAGQPLLTAPVSGSAAALAATLAASGGTSGIGFLQSGTGAVARTLQDKLRREALSLYDFYSAAQIADVAAGTGAIDVRAAINACLTEAIAQGSRTVLIPEGQHRIASNITFPTNVTLIFEAGAELKADSGVTVTVNSSVIAQRRRIFNVANGTYQGTFGPQARPEVCAEWWGAIGNGASTGDGFGINSAMTAVNAVGGGVVTLGAGVFLVGGQMTARSNVTLRGQGRELTTLQLVNATNQNMIFAGSATTGFTVEDITFDGNKTNNTAGAALDLSTATRPTVRRCRFTNTAGNGIVFQVNCVDGQITDNQFNGCGLTSGHSISLSACNRFVVKGNVIRNCADAGVNLGACSDCVVDGNFVGNDTRTTNGFGGIRMSGNANGNVIANNRISGFTRGVMNLDNNRVTITGNNIDNTDAEGILCQRTGAGSFCWYNHIASNIVANTGQGAASGSRDGIRLDGADYNSVVGNTIIDTTARMENGVSFTQNGFGNAIGNVAQTNNIYSWVTRAVSATNRDNNSLGPNMEAIYNRSIASAATIDLPEAGDYFTVTGTTGISTINGGYRGRLVTLQFSAALTVTDGGGAGNMNLAGNYVTAAGSVLTLRHTGGQWVEVARSNN